MVRCRINQKKNREGSIKRSIYIHGDPGEIIAVKCLKNLIDTTSLFLHFEVFPGKNFEVRVSHSNEIFITIKLKLNGKEEVFSHRSNSTFSMFISFRQ